MIGLTPRFARSCQIAQAEAQGLDTDTIPGGDEEDDEDTMKGMARLFAEIGEAFTSMIALGRFSTSPKARIWRGLQPKTIKNIILEYWNYSSGRL